MLSRVVVIIVTQVEVDCVSGIRTQQERGLDFLLSLFQSLQDSGMIKNPRAVLLRALGKSDGVIQERNQIR